ncbi:hypothetical protein CK203_021488 [Vitis vinifera]|uniref:Uncharacterized protein n=1 Tax=Vitis vinifera TaxID=29760 RepID=A0A438IS55_VITVI|nr:hypothetical protein CK203_078340 [Vitis vinifera]RVW99533.1 hypothetical protein CK203_021488 [Vitis vinifera]
MLESQNMEGSAMIANKGIDQKANTTDNKRTDRSKASNRDNKDNLCKEWGYNGGQQRDNGQAQLSSVQPLEEKYLEQGGFNREEIENLSALLGTLEKISNSSVINHMTHSSYLFNNSNPYPSSRKITTADGSLTIIGENSIKEDKGQDSYLIDPFLIDLPKVSSLVFDSVSIP